MFYEDLEMIYEIYSIIVIGISVLFVSIALQIWNKYGKDNKTKEKLEYYPPTEFNSAELGYIYKDADVSKSIVSLLIELANEGYLRIEDIPPDKESISNYNFRIIKIKEYDRFDKCKKTFFNELFKLSNSTNFTNMGECFVTPKDLAYNFNPTIIEIKKHINDTKENDIYEADANKKKRSVLAVMFLIGLLIVLPFMEDEGLLSSGIVSIFVFIIAVNSFIKKFFMKDQIKSSKSKNIMVNLILGFLCVYFIIEVLYDYGVMPLVTYIVGVICIAIINVIYINMSKRTPYGDSVFESINGFKRFFETAEKEQLEKLIQQNQEYMYKILPCVYVLGLLDIWISKFVILNIESPSWYNSYNKKPFQDFIYPVLQYIEDLMMLQDSTEDE